jgi:hypothetical protein
MKNNPINRAVILVQHFLKKYVTSLTFLVFLLALEACDFEVNPDNQENTNIISTNFRAFFDAYWREMNRSYVFWDIDGTDWDKVYTEYAPKFDTLEIGNEAHEKIAGMYFREILSGLSDSHYNVDFSSFRGMTQNDTIINGLFLPGTSFSPALWRKAQTENFYLGLLDPATPDLYADVDFQNYLDPENRYRVSTDNGGLTKPEELLVGTIQQKILYIRISTFNLTSRYSFDNKVREALNFFFKTLAAIPSNKIKGVIVDVRQNGGGDLRDLNLLMGRFVSKPTHFGYQHYKNGDNRLDYTPWLPFFVKPNLELNPNPKDCPVPVIALIDAHSISMAEITALAIRGLSEKNKLIGETTWGAMGALTDKNILTGGSFTIGINRASYTYTSSAATVDKQFKSYEGKGIPPDMKVQYDPVSLGEGIDRQLEAAIQQFN